MNNPQNIIVHHSVTPRDLDITKTETSIERTHKERGFPKSSLGWHIGYHAMIFGDGTIRQYRKDTDDGAHCKEQSMNFKSLGICVIGSFDSELPSEKQISTLTKYLAEKSKQYNVPVLNIYPHRKFATYKTCYGSKLPDEWARNLIKMPEQIKTQNYKGELRIVLRSDSMPTWEALCKVYGRDPKKIDEVVN